MTYNDETIRRENEKQKEWLRDYLRKAGPLVQSVQNAGEIGCDGVIKIIVHRGMARGFRVSKSLGNYTRDLFKEEEGHKPEE